MDFFASKVLRDCSFLSLVHCSLVTRCGNSNQLSDWYAMQSSMHKSLAYQAFFEKN